MKLLIIRHGPAGDKAKFAKTGRPDFERPLTSKGKEKTRRGAKGLRRLIGRIDILASSPLSRAWQTAEIVSKAFDGVPIQEMRELKPDADPRSAAKALLGRKGGTIALVGHEPHLGRLIALLCAGRLEPMTELKKGQVCVLELEPGRSAARILWSLTPSQLRRIRR